MNFYERLEIYPPILIRLMARSKGKPMTWIQICNNSPSLTPPVVEMLSQSTSWDGISVESMREFTIATGCDFTSFEQMKRLDNYIASNPRLRHIQKSPDFKHYYRPMLVKWRKSVHPEQVRWEPMRQFIIRLTPLTKI